jgi:ABC-type amino acid transport substrate-binding protein
MAAVVGAMFWIGAARCAEPVRLLQIAVYDVEPYGSADPNGLFKGVSVDLWRRVAEDLHLNYRLVLVPRMDDVLQGLEHGQYDAAIGAITVTPERLVRVDFSYPAHRSGVAVAFLKGTGPMAALTSYGLVASTLGELIGLTLLLLVAMGVMMWFFERPRRNAPSKVASAVTSLHEGIYCAVVTMTTVGYGDKTPSTRIGRFIAVVWMMASLVLISLLSTTLVSQMTAAKVHEDRIARFADLEGIRLAAVADSSGAEYLDSQHVGYTKLPDLKQALAALAKGETDAVVNSVGALEYLISNRFQGVISMPRGLLQPAYMAFALPRGSALKHDLDRALVRITADPEWRAVEASYLGSTD